MMQDSTSSSNSQSLQQQEQSLLRQLQQLQLLQQQLQQQQQNMQYIYDAHAPINEAVARTGLFPQYEPCNTGVFPERATGEVDGIEEEDENDVITITLGTQKVMPPLCCLYTVSLYIYCCMIRPSGYTRYTKVRICITYVTEYVYNVVVTSMDGYIRANASI